MFTKPYSDDRASIIDDEVSKMIELQYQRALKLLGENKDKLSELAEKLLTSEVIFKEDLEAIFGKRIWDKTEDDSKETEEKKVDPIEEKTDSEPIQVVEEVTKKPDLKTPPEFKEEDTEEKKETEDE